MSSGHGSRRPLRAGQPSRPANLAAAQPSRPKRPTARPLDQGQTVKRERRLGDWLDCQSHQQQRVVVARGAIGVKHVAAAATVDEHPFAIASDGDRDGFHGGAAVGGPVTRGVVDVPAPQAGWTVVPMLRARRRRCDVQAAMRATEGRRLVEPTRPRTVVSQRSVSRRGWGADHHPAAWSPWTRQESKSRPGWGRLQRCSVRRTRLAEHPPGARRGTGRRRETGHARAPFRSP